MIIAATRSLRTAAAAALALLVSACGGDDGPALGGTTAHDFGVVDFTGPDMVLEHEFELANIAGDTLAIEKLTSSCGCVKPSADATRIEPGGTVRIDAAMTIKEPGRTLEHITIVFAGDRRAPVKLDLKADARLVREVAAVEDAIAIGADGVVVLTLRAVTGIRRWPPDAPWWEPIEGLSIEFQGWREVEISDAGAAWEGVLRVRRDGPAPIPPPAPPPPPDASLLIRVGTHHELRLRISTP